MLGSYQQQQAPFNPMSVYQSQDPFGLTSGFMSKAAESVEGVKKELEAIGFNADKLQEIHESKLRENNSRDEQTPGG